MGFKGKVWVRTMKDELYNVKLNRHQLFTMQLACEVFSRVCTGQLHIALETAWPNKIFDLSSEKSDELDEHMQAITKILSDDQVNGWTGHYGIGSPEIHPKAMTSYNILQVIRNQFWKERLEDESSRGDVLKNYGVDAYVTITNGEKAIEIERIEDE